MFFREVAGPPGAPVLMLLHGWTATADLNFFTCYEALGQHFRVIAPDQRGHGRGIRSNKPFTLAACADDAAALADQLGIPTFIPVGYSMGGTVAQLMWKRHEQRVRALVLAATSGYFVSTRQERFSFLGLHGLGLLARVTPHDARSRITERVYLQRKVSNWEPWAAAQLQQHDWRTILEAGGALGSFNSRDWIRTVDAPSSVVITMRDRVVPVKRQLRLFEMLPHAEAFNVDADHDAVYAKADEFVPALVRACLSAVDRATK
jgi:3-oxoadipate enol-lactonase